MKKNYLKPVLYFEDFTLMDAISRICDVKAHQQGMTVTSYQDEMNCVAYDENFGMTLFVSGNSQCQIVSAYEHASWSYFGS